MTSPRPILIVEDDAVQCQMLADLATDDGFAASIALTLSEADALLKAPDTRFDAILLDRQMPDGDGHCFCAHLRQQGHKMPIIFVTGSGDEADIVHGLGVGANDYVRKPYRFEELSARLRAQLRLFDQCDDAVFTVGPYTFRPGAKLLFDALTKRRLRLTNMEIALLKILYQHQPKPVPRAVLFNSLWGDQVAARRHALEAQVYRLRQKLEDNPATPRLLLTTSGGYRLVVD